MRKFLLALPLALAAVALLLLPNSRAEDPPATDEAQAVDSPLASATAVWQMSKDEEIYVALEAELGAELAGDEQAASLARGGDGQVAQLDGAGFLVVGDETVELTGNEMTFAIRLQAKDGDWNGPIVSRSNDDAGPGPVLYCEDDHLWYHWQTSPLSERARPEYLAPREGQLPQDYLDGILRIGVPVDYVGREGWHDIVFVFRDTVIEFYVDGVLVDEEWTHGSLYNFTGPFSIGVQPGYDRDTPISESPDCWQGSVDHVALWDRALTDEEITALCGGEEVVAERDVEILGPVQETLQYWRPRGYNTFAGDAMCAFDGERFHVFWLYDRRQHHSKWVMGAHQYAHHSSADLVHWEQHPLAIPLTEQWESAMGTGDFLVRDGKFVCFYTDCGGRAEFPEKAHLGDGVFMATSDDGIHYDKVTTPVRPGGDCSIYFDEPTGLYYLIANGEGGVVYYTSDDLANWTEDPQMLLPLHGWCPHMFQWGDWYYLTVGSRFWRGESVTGPWVENSPGRISLLEYPKTADYFDGRKLACGWIGDHGWGGDLAMFELVQHDDGSLGTKFVPEMIPPSGEPVAWQPIGAAASEQGQVELSGGSGFETAGLEGIPQNARITCTVQPGENAAAGRFGLGLRGEGDYQRCMELQFRPGGERVQLNPGGDQHASDDGGWALGNVTGLAEPFTLDIIVTDTIVHVCIDDRYTLIARNYDHTGEKLFFFTDGGAVTFEDIVVRPLVGP